MTDIAFRSASDLTAAIRRREIGALELLELYFERVERLNPAINAVVALDAEGARTRAREADQALARGESWGPLHGLPITIKDSFEVVGMPTTSGSSSLRDHRPAVNAVAVQRLIDAGAVVFGKTNLPRYADDMQSYNEVYGTTNNPWDPTRSPGGSSGGSAAALASGLTGLELGTDIGGSIRSPAHYCGVYGHKPSFGLVSRRGHIPPSPGVLSVRDISVAGPMGRAADDLDLALDVVAGPDKAQATAWRLDLPPARHADLKSYRVAAWLDDPACPVDEGVLAPLVQAVEGLRGAAVEVDDSARPDLGLADSHDIYMSLLYSVYGLSLPDDRFEHFAALAQELPATDTTTRARFARAVTQPHRDWLATEERRQQLRARWAAFFTDFDVLLAPVVSTAAFAHDHSQPMNQRTLVVNGAPRPYLDQLIWAGLAGVCYLPATAAPVGFTPAGLPVGVQVIGPYLEDRTPIDFARRLADVIGGYVRPPNV